VGGIFLLCIDLLGINYPYAPPRIKFSTRVYHPNIDGIGRIALSLLGEKWSSSLTIYQGSHDSCLLVVNQSLIPKLIFEASLVLICISQLLAYPELQNPLVPEVAQIYLTDRPRYEETAREWTKKYAVEPRP
jgi:ubiquitin-conjugating enzyme E2 D